MIHINKQIPLGLSKSSDYKLNPQGSEILARWIFNHYLDLVKLHKEYKKEHKDEITFLDFCQIFFEGHRDVVEPHLN